MKGWAFLAFLGCFCHQARLVNPPHYENLCGLIVDLDFKQTCLECFEEAGSIRKHPEKYRKCVALYLPPLIAKCAVPHARIDGFDSRINQYKPVVHHNHTNANLLPNCLKRRMRDLSRYLKKENTFAQQAGKIVKLVVLSKMLPRGGPNILSAISQRYIFEVPSVKELVRLGAQSCLDDYESSRQLQRGEFDIGGEEGLSDDDSDLEEVFRVLQSDSMWEWNEADEDESYEEGQVDSRVDFGQEKAKRSFAGNGLPYGGTNPLAEEMILGKCIIKSLIETKSAIRLIQVIGHDKFFYPIPTWWVEPLLRYYKKYREELESGR